MNSSDPPHDKRPVDRLRDSALSMEVGTPEDPSAITGMLPIGGVLHIIKENGVYACRLADDIDPERTNPSIPNVQQKILSIGSASPLVGQTLLTAKKLFNKHYLPEKFDHEEALRLAFEFLKDVAAMDTIAKELRQAEALAQLDDRRKKDRSVVLPTVGDVGTRTKSFIQKADHALQSLLAIIRLFYGEPASKRWFESFSELVHHNYGPDDQFTKFAADILPFLSFIRNARNCVEHPKPTHKLSVSDFVLNAKMELMPPSIEVIHPKSPQPRMGLVAFMNDTTNQVVGIFELAIVFMCAKHVRPFAGMQFQVIELPESQRASSDKHVRFSYGLIQGDRVVPAG